MYNRFTKILTLIPGYPKVNNLVYFSQEVEWKISSSISRKSTPFYSVYDDTIIYVPIVDLKLSMLYQDHHTPIEWYVGKGYLYVLKVSSISIIVFNLQPMTGGPFIRFVGRKRGELQ